MGLGSRMARAADTQTVCFPVGVQTSCALGSNSNPVKSLCSTLEPMVSEKESVSFSSSWRKALHKLIESVIRNNREGVSRRHICCR